MEIEKEGWTDPSWMLEDKIWTEEEIERKMATQLVDIDDVLLLECPNGHEFKMTFREFENGERCPYCK